MKKQSIYVNINMGESFQDYSWIQDFKARKSASKCWIKEIIIASLIRF